MKQARKRFLSFLLSGVMTATLLPSQLPGFSLPASAAEPTDLTIDFDQSANSPEDAMSQLYRDTCDKEAWLQTDYSNICWKPALYWTCNNNPNDWSYEKSIRCNSMITGAKFERDVYP